MLYQVTILTTTSTANKNNDNKVEYELALLLLLHVWICSYACMCTRIWCKTCEIHVKKRNIEQLLLSTTYFCAIICGKM